MGPNSMNLPFERGATYFDGGTTNTTEAVGLCGQTYWAKDTVHGTGNLVKLMVVRAEADITVARKGVEFDTDALDTHVQVSGILNAATDYGYPIDDAYTVGATILAGDLFYILVEGPCFILSSVTASKATITAKQSVTWAANGAIDGDVAVGQQVVGVADQASTTTNTVVVIWVGFRPQGATA